MLALLVFGGLTAAWAIGEAALTPIDQPAPRTLALPTGVVLLASQVAGIVEHAACAHEHLWGAAVVAAGIALRLWAIATLRGAFVTALAPSRIMRTGPYRWMTHPSELGLVIAVGGTALLFASPTVTVGLGATIALAVARCRREDAALAAFAQ